MANAVWFVGKEGQQKGPYTEEEVRAMLARGDVAPADLVWKDGMADWRPAGQVPELGAAPPERPVIEVAEPAPGAAQSGQWHIGRDGEQAGPFSPEAIQAMIARGEIKPADMAWREGMAEWRPIGELADFAASFPPRPPGAPPAPSPFPSPTHAPAAIPSGALADLVKELRNDFLGILADPEKGLEAAADRKAVPLYLVWIGVAAIVLGLLGMQTTALLPFADAGMIIKALFKSLLVAAIVQGALVAALFVTLQPLLKTQAGWVEALSIVGLAAIPLAAGGLVVFVLSWLTYYAQALWAGILPVHILFTYHLFMHTGKVRPKVALYAVPCVCLATAIALGILARLIMF